jgi:hypothetical protein
VTDWRAYIDTTMLFHEARGDEHWPSKRAWVVMMGTNPNLSCCWHLALFDTETVLCIQMTVAVPSTLTFVCTSCMRLVQRVIFSWSKLKTD